jgi:hypothetical protein
MSTPKPGFWQRVFGPRQRATPAPKTVVTTTPKPTATKSGSRTKPDQAQKPVSRATPAAKKPAGTPPPKPDTEKPEGNA